MFLLFEHQIVDEARKHKGHLIIRKQQCIGCHLTLAIEVTDKLGKRGEYYVVKDALRFKSGVDLLFDKEVWFGNHIRCPNCGREGRLPMDKPLAAEEMAKPKEVLK